METKRARLNKWKPKKWRPEYDRIVAYSVMGKANVWIATNLGFTPEHVSTILNLPQGIELAERLRLKLRDQIETNIPDTLAYIAKKTAERLKQVIDDDDIFAKNPFAVIDRGMDVLKGLHHLSPSNGTNGDTHIGTVIISNGQKSDILDGMEKVAEIKRLHAVNE